MKSENILVSLIIATLIIAGIRALWYTDILISSMLTKGTLAYVFGTYGKDFLFMISIPVIYLVGVGFLSINTYFLISFKRNNRYVRNMFKITVALFIIIVISSATLLSIKDAISTGNIGVLEILGEYHIWLMIASSCFYAFSIMTIYNYKKHRIFIKVKELRGRSEWKENV